MFEFELLTKWDWALVAAVVGVGLLLIWSSVHWLAN